VQIDFIHSAVQKVRNSYFGRLLDTVGAKPFGILKSSEGTSCMPDHSITFARWRQRHKNERVKLGFATHFYTVSQKRLNFETVQLEIIRIGFDIIWQKCSKYSRIEFACFIFHVCLVFYQLFFFQTGHQKKREF